MRLLFWKAILGLTLYDLLLLGEHFNRLHRIVTNWPLASNQPPGDATAKVCDAVNRACIWYPKHALCLQRSVVTTCLLRSLGVSAEMVVGAQKLPFKAHSWVETNGMVINEKTDVRAIYGTWLRC